MTYTDEKSPCSPLFFVTDGGPESRKGLWFKVRSRPARDRFFERPCK